MSNSAASQIISDAEAITKVDTSTIGLTGLQTTMLLRVIDKANREYYQKFTLGGGEPKSDRTAETGGTILAATTTNGALTSASTSIILLSTTSFPTSGAGVLWSKNDPDFIEFTSVSSLTLNGVTGIGYNHATSEAFTVLYALPSNFESFRSADDSPDGVMINGIPYIFTSGVPYSNNFSIYDNGTTKYLFFPKGITGDYTVRYNKGSTTISAVSSIIDAPAIDENFITYRLVEHMERILAGDPNKPMEARNIANKVILDALKTRNVGKKLKTGRSYNVGGSRHRYPSGETVNQFIY